MSLLHRALRTIFYIKARTHRHGEVSDDNVTLCKPALRAPALALGLFFVPLACAGCIVMLYSLVFPTAEKTRKVMMEKVLVSCRAALIASAYAPAIDWRVLTRAPNQAIVTSDHVSLSWHDEVADAPHRRAPATCEGTLYIGMLTDLKINGHPRP